MAGTAPMWILVISLAALAGTSGFFLGYLIFDREAPPPAPVPAPSPALAEVVAPSAPPVEAVVVSSAEVEEPVLGDLSDLSLDDFADFGLASPPLPPPASHAPPAEIPVLTAPISVRPSQVLEERA